MGARRALTCLRPASSGEIEIYLRRGVRLVSASAYLGLTPAIVRYRTAGIFRELGSHDDGRTNYGAGTGCGGARYNLRESWRTTLLVWTAPETAETVRFKVTTATGKHGGFRNNAASFVANGNLPPPGSTPAGRGNYAVTAPRLSPPSTVIT